MFENNMPNIYSINMAIADISNTNVGCDFVSNNINWNTISVALFITMYVSKMKNIDEINICELCTATNEV